jgi:uncharacterized protein (DUF885 family)
MFTKIFALLIISAFLFQIVMAGPQQTEDQKFEKLAAEYIAAFIEMNPERATTLGDHRFDGRLNDYTLDGIKRERAMTEKYLTELNKIDFSKLSKINNIDARILRHNLESRLFQIDTLREYEWNPLVYNVGSAINSLISRDFAPLKERLASARSRLEQIPKVVAAAKANLKNPPRVHTETAILQNKGVINLIKGDLQMFADQAGMKAELAPAQAAAVKALEEYGVWLEKELLPRSNGDFRLGDEKFRRKLKFALQSDLTKEQILEHAMNDLKATQARMFEIAQPLFKKYFPDEVKDAETPAAVSSTDAFDSAPPPAATANAVDQKTVIKRVLDKLAEDRPTNETIVAQANEDLKEATEFVRSKKLVTVPAEPVKVIEMPEFARGSAVAYFDSAGPLEKKNETFFTISPTPSDWPAARKESFYKEYNDYMLKNLTVHEAMPGHYLQIMHSNKFKAPTMVRAIFRSGTFTEGWAVYAEQLMAEHGYGGEEVEMQQLKMKLRVIINAIIDQKIHTEGMTEREAVDFMMNEGFQEEGEAVGKWKRAQLSSTQLSTYYVGSVEVNEIRKAYEAKMNGKVDLLKMHDAMLSFGSPAPKYVRELLGL